MNCLEILQYIARVFFSISEEACVQLYMDIQSDSDFILPQEHVDAAIKFGLDR